MKTVKTASSLLLTLAMIISLSVPTFAAVNYVETPYGQRTNSLSSVLRYTNINTTYLSCDDTWIYADFSAKSVMSMRIDIKVYKNGSLVNSYYSTANDSFCAIDLDYSFIKGASYKVEATYKAGTESTTKSVSFVQ